MKLSYLATSVLGAGLSMTLATTASTAAPQDSARPQLAGVWKLNAELSENPGQKLMEAMRQAGGGEGRGGRGGGMGGPGMGGRGGGMGGAGMGGRGGEPGGGMRRPDDRGGPGLGEAVPPLDGAASDVRPAGPPPDGRRPDRPENSDGAGGRPRMGPRGLVPTPQFHIEQNGDNIAFRSESNLRLLHSDGQKRKRQNGASSQEVMTRFVGGTLVIETKSDPGGKRKETYTLRGDRTLQIDFDLSSSGRFPGVKFHLVYDLVPAPASGF